jgi:hypothetical protein
MKNQSIQGTYRHYKQHLYEVLGTVIHSESCEELVLYRSIEGSDEYPAGTLWVRPYKMFFETVLLDGKSVPRFEKMSDDVKTRSI